MKGKILNFEKNTGNGIISSEEGKRYKFNIAEWKENLSIERNMNVDFDISSDGDAREIFLINHNEEPKKGWFNKMPLMEKYFWGFILFFMLLYIIAQILIYSHQRKAQDKELPTRPTAPLTISNNVENSNLRIDKNMYKDIDILYKKIDNILLKEKADTKIFDLKLNKIYEEYRILIKKHVKFIERVAFMRVNISSYGDSIGNIYKNLKNDELNSFIKMKGIELS